jgi:UDP-glucose 4-epimerase
MVDVPAGSFAGARVLITGGLGFIGSNLALALVQSGADVTIADCMLAGHGGNPFNIDPAREQLRVSYSDVRDANIMGFLVRGQDYVFHLAGQVDHIQSLTDPYPDIDINIRGTAVVMEACRHHAPNARVIYTGTRGQYGPATRLPVTEDTPMQPTFLMEISNMTAEKIVAMYHQHHRVRSVMLRLTNIYGPRAQMQHPRYGVANWFVRVALEGGTIQLFGDGRMLRDFLYVDDCVTAMLRCALTDDAYGQVFNVATGRAEDFYTLATTLIGAAGSGRWEYAPFTPERAAQEPGDFYADIGRITRVTGWTPATSLREGLARTTEFYRAHRAHYW